jgi:polar amino acid transport system substrate-binding protein
MWKLASLVVGGLLAVSMPAAADSVKLATGNQYKPFSDESLPNGGLVTDLLRTAYEAAGHDVTIDFMPWKRGVRSVENGDHLATFPYVKTEERLKKYTYSDPVYVIEIVPAVTPENAGTINSLDDMNGKSTCLPVGWQFGVEAVDKEGGERNIDVQRPQKMASCFKLLQRGRVDFLLAERPAILADAKAVLGSVDALHIEDFVAAQSKLYLMFDKSVDPAKVEQANKALAALRESGRHQEIIEKHLR